MAEAAVAKERRWGGREHERMVRVSGSGASDKPKKPQEKSSRDFK
jgi:hypothetical protein